MAEVAAFPAPEIPTPGDAIALLTTAVDALAAIEPDALPVAVATELLRAVHGQLDRLRGLEARLLPIVELDGTWAIDGSRSFPVWLAGRTGQTVSAARRAVRMGRALRDTLPATAGALVDGTISADKAQAIALGAPTSEQRAAALTDPDNACNEGFLLRQAGTLSADQLGRLVRRWAAAADPESDERGYREALSREFVELSQTVGGYHLAGFLTEDHGQVLAAALQAAAGAPAAGDARTSAQRRAQALTDLARVVLDNGLVGTGAAVRPHLSVLVGFRDLQRALADGPRSGAQAQFEDGQPIPASALAALACDGELSRIVFGPRGEVLDLGRSRRTVPGPLRRAVIARDRSCQYPECDAPPFLCEVHHVEQWAHGGRTSVENSILLCRHHHHHVHRTEEQVRREGTRWIFAPRRM